ncbi:hypothetical protein ATC1_13858 [Flexilinea flocculi]|jgi:hypothetical protein|uniref:Uncharacterized protein n=1 Tax=Flexilinea flocculi TaxID=1678840 RepID=A0A0S7BKH7_9CHLR|nr:hypothetical protein ATC1_13858 [Flexilinea flocculi]
MKENIFLDPINVCEFGVDGVMLDVDGVAHIVYEFVGVVFSIFYSPRTCLVDQRIV